MGLHNAANGVEAIPGLRVFIDTTNCTRCAICYDEAPGVFVKDQDGVAHVNVDGDRDPRELEDLEAIGEVDPTDELDIVQIAEACRGECIDVEIVDETGAIYDSAQASPARALEMAGR